METTSRDALGHLPPFDREDLRAMVAINTAILKSAFFTAFGDFLTEVQELKDADKTPGCMDTIADAREHIMAVRQRFFDKGRDTEEDWWLMITKLVRMTNSLDLFDLDALAGQAYQLTKSASQIMRMMKEEEERGRY